jgi:hypothetical protein
MASEAPLAEEHHRAGEDGIRINLCDRDDESAKSEPKWQKYTEFRCKSAEFLPALVLRY